MNNLITLKWFEENEDESSESYGDQLEIEEDFPAKYKVCNRCNGHGTHLNPSIGEHAYTSEEFNEFSDEEKEHYFKRGGMYDVTCQNCKGLRVILVEDIDAIERNSKLKELYTRYEKWAKEDARSEAEYQQMCRMERLMGC